MVNLTIDGKQVTVPKDATIYDAAKSAGIKIPILCHDKKLHPFGGCRMCLVEVEQMKGRQIPACTTPVTEGMIVSTMTPEIVQARKMVLELLLLKHPIDCPVCDAAGDCDLQNLTYEYEVNANRFQDEKFQHQIDYENPLIERDMNRCVHCGKCARICDEIVSFGAYSFINRGLEAKIGTPFDGPLSCEFCGSCISVCPVGALISRPFKFKARWWSLNKVKTVCSYCGTGCNLTLGVKDGKILTTVYDEDQGFHNGQLCTRGRFGYQFVNSASRLTTPLIKKNGKLEAASWDEALGVISQRLIEGKAAGGSSVAGLVTPRLTNEELYLFKKLFNDAVGTDNIDHAAGYAHEALSVGAAQSVGFPASPAVIADIQGSDLLLVVKTDAYETHPVLGFEINLAVKRKGVGLRIVSDKYGKLAKLPSAVTYIHKPGYEVKLFNALAKIVIDEGLANNEAVAAIPGYEEFKRSLEGLSLAQAAEQCGVTVEELTSLAHDYAAASKALILMPTGLGYPGHGKELAHAVMNLALVAGKIDAAGGGVLILGEKNNSQGAADLKVHPVEAGKNAAGILEGCTTGTIKTLYIVGENPVVSYPNRKQVELALEKADFVIVQDLFLTETAAKADVVLPACSFAEKEGTFTSVGKAVQRIYKAIKPIGLAKSDFEIFNQLYGALGGEKFAGPEQVFADIAASVPGYGAIEYAALGTTGAVYSVASKPKLIPVAGNVYNPEPGKLALVTGSALNHCGTLSLHGEGPMFVCPNGYAEFNTEDAARLGIRNDDLVTLKSPVGEVQLKAKVSVRLPVGMAFAPYHFAENSINNVMSGAAIQWVSVSK